ncbi:hypothetical protein GY45DRAFT_1376493 [Cubamyces sp. BRFM 1775]|nr:hypothetical protein GY45DRAFT_1376493 [Cubamyces sp. BRFM 1775]
MTFREQPGIAQIPERQAFFRDSVVNACVSVSLGTPDLQELSITCPSGISIPVSTLKLFPNLRHANVQVGLVPGPILDPNAPFTILSNLSQSESELSSIYEALRSEPVPRLEHLEGLKLKWGIKTHAADVLSTMRLDGIRQLAVHTDRRLGQRFIFDMNQLTTQTSSNLTSIEILSYRQTIRCTTGGRLVEVFAPLLSRPQLREVRIELQPYNFSLPAADVAELGRAWPLLEKLHVSFRLRSRDILPTLHHTLISLSESCVLLQYLHLPGIATGIRLGPAPITLPSYPESKLQHISSDYLQCTHSAFDIAAALYTSFPRIVQAGPRLQLQASKWEPVNVFLQMMRHSSSLTAVQEAFSRLRLPGDRQISVSLYRMALYNGTLPNSTTYRHALEY